jgi:tetraacyldisaccharide 4'-kinase
MICFVFSPLVNFLRKILYPFSLLYGLITTVRNYLYNKNIFKSTQFKTPTIVVGNLSVGGTGKTPQVEYLIRLLQNKYKIAVLSRGYKRKTKGFIIADENVTAEIIGDEPYQYYQKFPSLIVSVDVDRRNGIQQLKQLKNPPEIILLDDAFQHRKIEGGFNILLTSYKNLYVDDALLPTGNLREKVSGADRAQVIIVTKCPNNLSVSSQLEITKKLHPTQQQSVFFTGIDYDIELKGSSSINLTDLEETEVLLVTGIANPNPLITYLKSKNITVNHLKYPDHHHYNNRDLVEIKSVFNSLQSNNKIVLTTEKDYVRIFGRLKKLHYITIKTIFLDHKNDFDNLVNTYVEQSSGNS